MTIHRLLSTAVLLGLMAALSSTAAWADNGNKWQKKTYNVGRHHYNDRYYPPRGHVIQSLPRHYHVVPHRDTRYYYHSGIWYRPSGAHFVVSIPPVGLVVPFLPPYYTTVWVGSVPYYYSGGVYYTWHPHNHSYVVTEPPPSKEIVQEAPDAEELFIYPKKEQSEQQQATDRYECHRWALGQTGFDPTKPNGNVPSNDYAGKREDYQRALRACLEARDYSVR